ncbi:unnamed protein product [Adineta ricciae]|uniref:Uncharacterized protein n=1 Tax=Adineta ricciae TaxID=249248 RepID=A0A815S8G7_ADIRI|nr:unnamed protein product [Adineta ricciae]
MHSKLTSTTIETETTASKYERWRLKLRQYRFTVQYIKGKHNTVVDYLTRSPLDTAFDDPDDYSPTQSRATQTENPTPASIIAPVVARSRAKQQLDKVANDNPINQSRDERAKRNNELTQNSSCKKTITEHQQVMETDNQIIPFTQERLKELQHQDDEIQQLMKNIDASDDYIMMDNMLIKNSIPPVPFVPNGRLRSDIIKIYHDTPANGAHFGRD